MSKVMVETNVWVDVILSRPEFVAESKGAIMACIEEGDEVFVAATTLRDVFFFATKSASADAGYRAVELMLEVASLAQVDERVCRDVISLERPDYEDGIVATCARAEQVDAIITRDERAFSAAGARKYTPAGFLSARGFEPA